MPRGMGGNVGYHVVYCLGPDFNVSCASKDPESDISEDCDWKSFGTGGRLFDRQWDGELGRKFEL